MSADSAPQRFARTYDIKELQAKLGEKQGYWLYNAIRGKDIGEGKNYDEYIGPGSALDAVTSRSVVVRLHTKSMTSRKDFLPPLKTLPEIVGLPVSTRIPRSPIQRC